MDGQAYLPSAMLDHVVNSYTLQGPIQTKGHWIFHTCLAVLPA